MQKIMYHIENTKVIRSGRTVLDLPALQLSAHGLTVILGHNGSGKSTLLQLLAGHGSPDQGHVLLHGRPLAQWPVRQLARQVAWMPQHLPASTALTVRELVQLGRFAWRGWLRPWRAEDRHWCEQALQQTQTTALGERLLSELSGGERQRAWLAMLLAQQAPMLLLDEPSAALDLAHQYSLLQLLRRLTEQGQCAVVAILHDLNLALRYADRIIALHSGRLWFDGSPGELLQHPQLTGLYGIDLDIVRRDGKAPVAVVA